MRAFNPKSNTYVIPAATTAPTGVQIVPFDGERTTQYDHYRIVNEGDENVTLGWGSTAAIAQTNAGTKATSGTPQNNIQIYKNSIEVLRLPPNCFISGETAAATADLFICVGEGV